MQSTALKHWIVFAAGGLALLAAASPGHAAEPPRHVGVVSCSGAGGGCHALTRATSSSQVRQDEYETWSDKDRHAKAYDVLLGERSIRIAKNLNLPAPAHESPECLRCHSDYGEPRMATHHYSDGVQCEACHGGAERWLPLHLAGDHQVNVEAGLAEIDDPLVRARLCLSCHLGSGERFVSHRMMGAGHPRLRGFELDTFTLLQPAHFDVDADYTARNKKAYPSSTVWAVGQVEAARYYLQGLATHASDGAFPELVFYDCHACHHEMEELRWQPRASHGMGPGLPRLNDSGLLMLRLIVEQAWPERLSEYETAVFELHKQSASGIEQTRAAAKRLLVLTDGMSEALLQRGFGESDVRATLTALVEKGLAGEYLDYAATEQAAMALGVIQDSLSDALTEAESESLDDAFNRLHDLLLSAVKRSAGGEPALASGLKNSLKALQPLLP